MLRTISLTILLTVMLGVFAVEPAVAGKKKPKDKPVTCGAVIDTPGNYFLSGDCIGPGIRIDASNVTLNLKGHTMEYGLTGLDIGIRVQTVSKLKIIGPGTIRGYNTGIDFDQVSHSTVQKVSSINNNNGMELVQSTDNEIEKSVFSGNVNVGLFVIFGSDNKIEGNKFNGSPDGLVIDQSTDNEVEDNTANGNSRGIVLESGATGNEVKDNTANGNSSYGIFIALGATGNEIEENRASNTSLDDLHDENPDCDDNEWEDNDFSSANQPCID